MTVVDLDEAAHEAAIAGLRELADFIEDNPEFAELADTTLNLYVANWYEDADRQFADLARKLGGHRTKSANERYLHVTRMFGPLEVSVFTNREVVCERVVVGTETVEVPDPNAAKVTVEREIVEWECKSILNGDES